MTPNPPASSSLRDLLRRHGVSNPSVIAAIERVPRASFLPPEFVLVSHEDRTFTLGSGADFVAPTVLGRLLESLALHADATVLETGSGFGYAAAVLHVLGAKPTVLAADPEQARETHRRLSRLGLSIPVVTRVDLDAHGSDRFERVFVGAPVEAIEPRLEGLLEVGGSLVAAVRDRAEAAAVFRVDRVSESDFVRTEVTTIPVVFRIGDLLVAMGVTSREDVERVAKETRRRLGEALLDHGYVKEADLFRALAQQARRPFANAEEILHELDPVLAASVPNAFVEARRMLPYRKDDGTIFVVTSEPTASAHEVAMATSCTASEVRIVTPTDFRRIRTAVALGQRAPSPDRSKVDDDLLERHPLDDAHLVGLFEAILLEAIGERASDIHLERYGQRVRIRLRIDGDLRDVPHITMNANELAGVINVLKVAADMDISERRLPQGGRFRRRAADDVFDLRVQTQPSLHGEHAVIRLLPQTTRPIGLESLGFEPRIARSYRRLLDSPAGLVLVVGPTGSGKSTTLYAALQVLATDGTRKVITVEDPIEYSIENIQQTQVHPEIGFAFATAVRSFVRQDPDVILVGEIRDAETALEAIRASQTGHVVLSTLHCNDSVDAVQRLVDLGMHPNSIASELLAVLAQRLAKRICPHCKTPDSPSAEVLAELFPNGTPADFRCWKGAGCERCRGHGTFGRVAAVEFLRATPELRRAISRRLAVDDLRDVAISSGLHSMRESALALVRGGVIPVSELPSLLPVERMAERLTPPLP